MDKREGLREYKLNNSQTWEEFFIGQTDKGSIFKLACRWAHEMEQHIDNGEVLDIELAEKCFHVVDDGATGPVFTAARRRLIQTWLYGNQLSQVYNSESISVDQMFDIIQENDTPWYKKVWKRFIK